MKKIVVVSTSPRRNGNSDLLAQEFVKGAIYANHQVKFINFNDIKVNFCKGCMYCAKHENCIQKDDMNNLLDEIQNADILVFASPVYYYSVCGQLKTFLDRLNPLYVRKNKFSQVYLLSTCAEDDIKAIDGSITDIKGWIACFENAKFGGCIKAIGVSERGDINKTDFLKKAYDLGKKL